MKSELPSLGSDFLLCEIVNEFNTGQVDAALRFQNFTLKIVPSRISIGLWVMLTEIFSCLYSLCRMNSEMAA
jgi:hypothetical protein